MFQQVKSQDDIDKLVAEFLAVQTQLKAKSEIESVGVAAIDKDILKRQSAIVKQLQKGTAELIGQLTPIQQVLGVVSDELVKQGVAQPNISSILTNLSSKSTTSNEVMRNLFDELVTQGASIDDITGFIQNITPNISPADALSVLEQTNLKLTEERDGLLNRVNTLDGVIKEGIFKGDAKLADILKARDDAASGVTKVLDAININEQQQESVIANIQKSEPVIPTKPLDPLASLDISLKQPLDIPPVPGPTLPPIIPGSSESFAPLPPTVFPDVVKSGNIDSLMQIGDTTDFTFNSKPVTINKTNEDDILLSFKEGPPIAISKDTFDFLRKGLTVKQVNRFNFDKLDALIEEDGDGLVDLFTNQLSKEELDQLLTDPTASTKEVVVSNLLHRLNVKSGLGMSISKKSRGKQSLKNNIGKMQRHQYKITSGNGVASFGKVQVDLPQLQGFMRLIASKDDKIILDEDIDQDTFDILTKRCKRGCKYSPDAIRIFRKMVKFGELPISPTSKKFTLLKPSQQKGVKPRGARPRKKKGGVIRQQIVPKSKPKFTEAQPPLMVSSSTPDELIARLGLLASGLTTGNNSPIIKNQIAQIADELLAKQIITGPSHKQIYIKYGLV